MLDVLEAAERLLVQVSVDDPLAVRDNVTVALSELVPEALGEPVAEVLPVTDGLLELEGVGVEPKLLLALGDPVADRVLVAEGLDEMVGELEGEGCVYVQRRL